TPPPLFRPKGIRTRIPACTAVPGSKRESGAFTASLRSIVRRGRQAFGAKSRRRHSPQADAGGHLPRRPAGRAGPVRSRRGVRSVKRVLPRTWVKNQRKTRLPGGRRAMSGSWRESWGQPSGGAVESVGTSGFTGSVGVSTGGGIVVSG